MGEADEDLPGCEEREAGAWGGEPRAEVAQPVAEEEEEGRDVQGGAGRVVVQSVEGEGGGEDEGEEEGGAEPVYGGGGGGEEARGRVDYGGVGEPLVGMGGVSWGSGRGGAGMGEGEGDGKGSGGRGGEWGTGNGGRRTSQLTIMFSSTSWTSPNQRRL